MQEQEHSENHEVTPTSAPSLIELSTMIYSLMGAVGLGIAYWTHGTIFDFFAVPDSPEQQLRLLTIALLGTGVLSCLSLTFEHWFDTYRILRRSLMPTLGSLSIISAAYLSGLSAFAEELLFRGAFQPNIGIFFASLLFGALHLGPGGHVSAWTAWAVLSGLVLGAIAESTHSLVPGILIHFLVNLFSISMLRRDWQRLSVEQQRLLKGITAEMETND